MRVVRCSRPGTSGAGSRLELSQTSTPSSVSSLARCGASRAGVVAVGRVAEDEVVGARAPARAARTASIGRTVAFRPSLSRFASITRHASRSCSTKVARAAPRRERLEPHRAGAGEQVEHLGVVDRPDQVERVLAHAVGGRPGVAALRCGDPVAAVRAGDDPHAHGPAGRRSRSRLPRRVGEEDRVVAGTVRASPSAPLQYARLPCGARPRSARSTVVARRDPERDPVLVRRRGAALSGDAEVRASRAASHRAPAHTFHSSPW